MQVMARDRDYGDLVGDLRGRSVLVWTCDTCARFCGIGGRDRAEDIASRLSSDGIAVSGVVRSSACCFMRKAREMAASVEGYDMVLALCCDMGARNASEATGREVLNPVVTFGPGYLDDGGAPRIASVVCGRTVVDEPLSEAAARSGCQEGPLRRSHARIRGRLVFYMSPR